MGILRKIKNNIKQVFVNIRSEFTGKPTKEECSSEAVEIAADIDKIQKAINRQITKSMQFRSEISRLHLIRKRTKKQRVRKKLSKRIMLLFDKYLAE